MAAKYSPAWQIEVVREPPTSIGEPSHRSPEWLAIDAASQGHLAIFLGAGASVLYDEDRPSALGAPTAKQLAKQLAERYYFPSDEEEPDLTRVAQWVCLKDGRVALEQELQGLAACEPSLVLRFLASMEIALRQKGYQSSGQLYLTTNFDLGLEKAFADAEIPLYTVTFLPSGAHRGGLLCRYSAPDYRGFR